MKEVAEVTNGKHFPDRRPDVLVELLHPFVDRPPRCSFVPNLHTPHTPLDVLAAVFAEDGGLTARPAGTSTWSADFGHHHNTTGESTRAAAAAIKNMNVDSKKFLA